MMKALAAAALAATISLPASAQSMKSERSDAALHSKAAADTPKAKASKKKPIAAVHVQRMSHYSTNPEYDVYVNGVYAGSDPDPRIRWTLRQEAKGQFGLR
jgi:hypothetical protein